MTKETLEFIAISLASLLNLAMLGYQTFKKVPREVEKMKAEKEQLYSDIAESNMEGAQISNTLLLERIRELKKDKRDAWNHIAKLEKRLIEKEMTIPPFVASESEPKINSVHKRNS